MYRKVIHKIPTFFALVRSQAPVWKYKPDEATLLKKLMGLPVCGLLIEPLLKPVNTFSPTWYSKPVLVILDSDFLKKTIPSMLMLAKPLNG